MKASVRLKSIPINKNLVSAVIRRLLVILSRDVSVLKTFNATVARLELSIKVAVGEVRS